MSIPHPLFFNNDIYKIFLSIFLINFQKKLDHYFINQIAEPRVCVYAGNTDPFGENAGKEGPFTTVARQKQKANKKKYIKLWGYHRKFSKLIKQFCKFQDVVANPSNFASILIVRSTELGLGTPIPAIGY
jgi:hypothetical protein